MTASRCMFNLFQKSGNYFSDFFSIIMPDQKHRSIPILPKVKKIDLYNPMSKIMMIKKTLKGIFLIFNRH